MISQVRYPNSVIQKESDDDSEWVNLDNIKLDNWERLAECSLKAHQKPATLYLTDFDFNIPEKAVISQIIVEIDYSKENTHHLIQVNPPIIKLGNVKKRMGVGALIYPLDRAISFQKNELHLDIEDINNGDLDIEIEFPENSLETEGVLFLDYVRVKVLYEFPMYLLSSGETNQHYPVKETPLKKNIGDTVEYYVFFRNSNGLLENKQSVNIIVPEGLEFVKYKFKENKFSKVDKEKIKVYEDEFDKEKMIWYPSVRGKGLSTLRLSFKCVKEGTYSLNAFNDYTGISKDFFVEIHPKGEKLPENKFEEEIKKSAGEDSDKEYEEIEKETSIKIENVSMEFEMPQEKIDNLKEYVIKFIKREIKPKKHFKALDNVTFEIKKGERVGIIGFNGAGKSTLLKVLSGVYKPTSGSTMINGKVAPLLELGAGFDHNYNGRENIFLNGSILGYSKKFLENKYEEIVEFSELGEFIEVPIKNYSSGMKAKLGFAVATIVDPEILILDEVLSVGDARFQKKSGDKIKAMMSSGTTVLLVSHSTAKIRELCTRAIWLDHGKLVMDGDVDYVCDAYIEASKRASADELKDLEIV